MTVYDITEIADAMYMGLMCPPEPPEAKLLVNDIVNIIEQAEKRQRDRKAKDNAAFRSAVGLITGDLLIAMELKEHGWSYHGLSPAAFDNWHVGYKTFKPIVETMEAVGLISISKECNSQAPQFDEGATPSYHPSLATRFRPTQVMVSIADGAGVRHGSARKHFPQQLPNNVIEVRSKSTTVRGMKTKGKKLKFTHTEKSRAMEADVKSLNISSLASSWKVEAFLAIEGSSVTATSTASTSSGVVVFMASATTATRISKGRASEDDERR